MTAHLEKCNQLFLRECYVNPDDLERLKKCNHLHLTSCYDLNLNKYDNYDTTNYYKNSDYYDSLDSRDCVDVCIRRAQKLARDINQLLKDISSYSAFIPLSSYRVVGTPIQNQRTISIRNLIRRCKEKKHYQRKQYSIPNKSYNARPNIRSRRMY